MVHPVLMYFFSFKLFSSLENGGVFTVHRMILPPKLIPCWEHKAGCVHCRRLASLQSSAVALQLLLSRLLWKAGQEQGKARQKQQTWLHFTVGRGC